MGPQYAERRQFLYFDFKLEFSKEVHDELLLYQSYIGYTTTTVKQRMTTHAQNGSTKNHNNEAHYLNKQTKEIMNEI